MGHDKEIPLLPGNLAPRPETLPVAAPLPEVENSRETVPSHLRYAFQMVRNRTGQWVPCELGQGKFARVLRGQQQIGIQPARSVAIKILHSHATLAHERLFATEIGHLRQLSDADNVNVLQFIDVLQLKPLVLCGCGRIYHPNCPQCGREALSRTDVGAFPALCCTSCTYVLPGNRIMDRSQELSSALARTCCKGPAVEGRGTILNFVHREAIVMEHLTLGLKDFSRQRREDVIEQWKRKASNSQALVPASKPDLRTRLAAWLPKRWVRDRFAELIHKALLLEKVLVAVQLVESVTWLHGEKQIVHKDLASDNVMIRFAGQAGNRAIWRGEHRPEVSARDILNDMTGYPTIRALLIDFGLADHSVPTRSWYDDAEAAGQHKGPFLSPEAKNRRQEIALEHSISFSPSTRTFSIPPELRGLSLPLMQGDIISHSLDEEHLYDLKIEAILDSGKTAKYLGDLPEAPDYRRCVVERPLLEPHDVFALGALFYFLLSEDLTRVERLHALVDTAQEMRRPVGISSIRSYDLFPSVRKAIRASYWQDEMLVIILRAMTRGLPGSYAKTRIDRGAEPAQRFLLEIKRLHHEIQRDIIARSR